VYPHVHYQAEEVPVILSYRSDLVVSVEINTEVGDELHIVLNRRMAADLRNMLDIYLDG
jgi:hypothetical protein